jgi:hypothetical protein
MRLTVQYLNDPSGQLKAIQLPIADWDKLMNKLSKYEQILKIKSDLTEAFAEVKKIRNGKLKKQTLSDFLKEL